MLKYRQRIANYLHHVTVMLSSDVEVAPEPEQGSESDQNMRLPHTGVYSIKSRSSFFVVFISDEIEENDLFDTEYVVLDESSFTFTASGK